MSRYGQLLELSSAETDDCILWPYATSGGYPALRIDRRGHHGHRLVCVYYHGPAPPGAHAAHSCDVKLCVNPRHIRWDTPAGNALEASNHGLYARGERHASSKLTESDVRAIRASTETQRALAQRYGVTKGAISAILLRKSWKWLDPLPTNNNNPQGESHV